MAAHSAKGRFVVVSTTLDSAQAAARMANRIVRSRLAACVQRLPIRSTYWWKGRIENAPEHLLLAKTRSALAAPLAALIARHHSYEVPEITVTPIAGGSDAYLAWIREETAPRKSGRR